MSLPPFPRPRITPDMLPREVWPVGRSVVFLVSWAAIGAMVLAGLAAGFSSWF